MTRGAPLAFATALAACTHGALEGAGPSSARSTPGAGVTAPSVRCVPAGAAFTATAWPVADQLFRRSARWLGADAAFSVPLGGDRVLWLFGDTFVDPTGAGRRAGASMPHNTIGLQRGLDPSTATIEYAWRSVGGKPSSFFPDRAGSYLWPQHGVRLASGLLVFLAEIARVDAGLGFEAKGGTAVLVDNPDDPPADWRFRWLAPPAHAYGAILGAAAIATGGFLHALAIVEPGRHDALLARFSLTDAEAGHLDAPAWWSGVDWPPRGAAPSPLWRLGAPELSVSARCDGSYLAVESTGFGGTTLGVRTAPALVGPWTAPTAVYTPPESKRADVLVYAGKAHPELAGADLVATYATNRADFAALVADESVYYPRFVRIAVGP